MRIKVNQKDRIIKLLAYEGRISVTCASTTNLVEEARKLHDLSPVCTAALGRMLTMTAMMATNQKSSSDKLTIQMKGNGPIGTMITVANNFPNIKGYVVNPHVDLPLTEDGKLDVSGAVGKAGYLNIIKDLGLKKPYIGMSPIISGEIAEDFANYYVTSEQKPSAVALGVLVDKDGVKSSGGYIISPMPDAKEEDIHKIEAQIFQAGAISKMLDQNLSLEEIARKITGDDEAQVIGEEIYPAYECDCSKENMEKALISLGKEELQDMIEQDGKAELVCHFCNQKYNFTKGELQELLEESK